MNKNNFEQNQTLLNNNLNENIQTKHKNKFIDYNKFHINKYHKNNKNFTKNNDNINNKNLVSISTNIPLTSNDAITCKNKEYWKNAIKNELNNL